MYAETRTDVLTVTRGLQDLSHFLFFCLMTNQPRLMMIKPMSSPFYTTQANSFPNFLEMHCCATLLWGKCQTLYHTPFPCYWSEKLARSCNWALVTFTLGIYRDWTWQHEHLQYTPAINVMFIKGVTFNFSFSWDCVRKIVLGLWVAPQMEVVTSNESKRL